MEKFKVTSLGNHKKIVDCAAEIDAKILAYQAAQNYQLEHGGPGPVADYDVMSIVNEYGGQYEITATEEVEIVQ